MDDEVKAAIEWLRSAMNHKEHLSFKFPTPQKHIETLIKAATTPKTEYPELKAMNDKLIAELVEAKKTCEKLVQALEPFAAAFGEAEGLIQKDAKHRSAHVVRSTTYWLSYNDFRRAHETVSDHRAQGEK